MYSVFVSLFQILVSLLLSLFAPRKVSSVGQFLHRVRVLCRVVADRCAHSRCRLRLDVRWSWKSSFTFHKTAGKSYGTSTFYGSFSDLPLNRETLGGHSRLLSSDLSALAAAALALLLPETRNRRLPETMQDGENFGRWRHKNIFIFSAKY